jgi:hypothetical protein
MDASEQQISAACDWIVAAINGVIRSGDDEAAREVVPELDRLRHLLQDRLSDRRIRLSPPLGIRVG